VNKKCEEFSVKYGNRFSPGSLIKKLASEKLTFYEHY
jgi:hypothetical protein